MTQALIDEAAEPAGLDEIIVKGRKNETDCANHRRHGRCLGVRDNAQDANLPRKPLLPTGVPDKTVDEARLAGLPLSGGRDEEVLAAHSAHSQRCPPRV